MKIKDLEKGNVEIFLLIEKIVQKVTTTGKPYLDIMCSDGIDKINSKFWDRKIEDIVVKEMEIVKVFARVDEYNGNKQLIISKLENVDQYDDFDVKDFIKTAPLDAEAMIMEVKAVIKSIKDEEIKSIVSYIFKEELEKGKIKYYPAAKAAHHDIYSGLLYHMVRMLRLAYKITEVYENINKDLILAGIILHDIEKINELDANEFGIVSDYTTEGKLLGHIIMGIKRVSEVANKLSIAKEKSILLEHIILAHHGKPEFGSPKSGMFIEAEILHYIDMIDSRVYMFEDYVKNLEKGEFSKKNYMLGNIEIYNHKL